MHIPFGKPSRCSKTGWRILALVAAHCQVCARVPFGEVVVERAIRLKPSAPSLCGIPGPRASLRRGCRRVAAPPVAKGLAVPPSGRHHSGERLGSGAPEHLTHGRLR